MHFSFDNAYPCLRMLVYVAPRLAYYPIRRFGEGYLLRTSEHLQYEGFDLYDATDQDHPYEMLFQVRRGLELIAEIDPHRFRRIRRQMPRIAIMDRGGTRFWYATRTGVLDRSFVRTASAPNLAVMIVHTAARMRFANAPFGYRIVPANHDRIFYRATREQILFASKLPPERFPGVEKLLAFLHDQLASHSRRGKE